MSSVGSRKLNKDDSFEDFEFFDAEDLEIDLPESPAQKGAEKSSSGIRKIISILCTIVEEKGLIISLPFETIVTTAVGAIGGSLIGGAPGMVVGVLTAAILTYRASSRHKSPKTQPPKTSIRQIFEQMTMEQKKELLKELLSCLKQSNVRCLILEILKNEGIRSMALEILSGFLMRKMGISLVKPK